MNRGSDQIATCLAIHSPTIFTNISGGGGGGGGGGGVQIATSFTCAFGGGGGGGGGGTNRHVFHLCLWGIKNVD